MTDHEKAEFNRERNRFMTRWLAAQRKMKVDFPNVDQEWLNDLAQAQLDRGQAFSYNSWLDLYGWMRRAWMPIEGMGWKR